MIKKISDLVKIHNKNINNQLTDYHNIIKIIKNKTEICLELENIKIINGILKLKTSPIRKLEILIRKKDILLEINKNKKIINNIT
jgi:hypothetical protein